MEDVRTFYTHFEYFSAIWYILWHFCVFSSYLASFPPVLVFVLVFLKQEKSGNPVPDSFANRAGASAIKLVASDFVLASLSGRNFSISNHSYINS
jgi:hypothetical protein